MLIPQKNRKFKFENNLEYFKKQVTGNNQIMRIINGQHSKQERLQYCSGASIIGNVNIAEECSKFIWIKNQVTKEYSRKIKTPRKRSI